jgi:hypothetical protein
MRRRNEFPIRRSLPADQPRYHEPMKVPIEWIVLSRAWRGASIDLMLTSVMRDSEETTGNR